MKADINQNSIILQWETAEEAKKILQFLSFASAYGDGGFEVGTIELPESPSYIGFFLGVMNRENVPSIDNR